MNKFRQVVMRLMLSCGVVLLGCSCSNNTNQRDVGIADANIDSKDTGALPAVPYYFIAIHNEPYHTNPNAAQLRAQSYTILKQYVDKATLYGIRLTLMFSAQLADYIAQDVAKKAEVLTWKSKGHEFAIHHHSIYHGSWDGYTWYSQANAILLRKCQGKTVEPYLGDLDDFMAKVNQLSTGIKAGCAADEDDRKEIPDAIINDTCSGFTNNGTVGTRSDDGKIASAKNEYYLAGQVRGIERHWLDHFIGVVDVSGAQSDFSALPTNQVFGTIYHSSSNDESAFNTFIDFLHTKDPSGAKSRTVSQIIDESLLPKQTLSQDLVDKVYNNCVVN